MDRVLHIPRLIQAAEGVLDQPIFRRTGTPAGIDALADGHEGGSRLLEAGVLLRAVKLITVLSTAFGPVQSLVGPLKQLLEGGAVLR